MSNYRSLYKDISMTSVLHIAFNNHICMAGNCGGLSLSIANACFRNCDNIGSKAMAFVVVDDKDLSIEYV